jgi:archaetidylinositol phosphate synthase
MTLDQLRPTADRILEPFVDLSERLGLSPDGISLVAFLVALGAGAAFFLAGEEPQLYLAGAGLVFVNGWLDLLDGAVARRLDRDRPAGDLLDHVIDRYADIAVVAGLAAGVEAYALGFAAVTGVLMTSYLGTQAEAVGLARAYGGYLGRADRLVLIGVAAVAAAFVDATVADLSVVGWLLVLFAVGGHLTAVQRFYYAWSDLEDRAAKERALAAAEERDAGGNDEASDDEGGAEPDDGSDEEAQAVDRSDDAPGGSDDQPDGA